MLKRKALKRIYLTTLVLFIMLITFSFNNLEKEKVNDLGEVEFVSNLNTSHIYLINNDNYLVKVDILLDKDDIVNMAKEVLNNLSINNKKYNNLKGLIPSNTKINDISYENNTLTIEYFPELVKFRKTKDILSQDKLDDLIKDYKQYHKNNFIPDERKVHMTKEEILNLNK